MARPSARKKRIEPEAAVVARLAEIALALPEAYEEDAWTGVRWRIRSKTFAHVMVAQEGYESSYRDITGVADPTTILTFQATGEELLALAHAGPPFFKPPWSPTVVGMALDGDTDWDEVADLVTESYRFCAPQKLARILDRGDPDRPPHIPPGTASDPDTGRLRGAGHHRSIHRDGLSCRNPDLAWTPTGVRTQQTPRG